jgi:hypothetical protein
MWCAVCEDQSILFSTFYLFIHFIAVSYNYYLLLLTCNMLDIISAYWSGIMIARTWNKLEVRISDEFVSIIVAQRDMYNPSLLYSSYTSMVHIVSYFAIKPVCTILNSFILSYIWCIYTITIQHNTVGYQKGESTALLNLYKTLYMKW